MKSCSLDESKCTGCKICYKACWLDVIRWDEKTGRPFFAYPQDCVECNYCEISCPSEAINIKIDYDKPFPDAYISGIR